MIIRIDDYPTGVKPIIEDRFEKFAEVLGVFEEHEVPYHLGVVPKLIDDKDLAFLSELKYCHICMHGYDHNFFIWDPKNENRDEFKNDSTSEIVSKLVEGKQLLSNLNLTKTFIPTFNRTPQNLVDALCVTDFEAITTGVEVDKTVNYKSLKLCTPKSIFYGTSTLLSLAIQNFEKGDHLALHLTWEIEQKRKKGSGWKLPMLVEYVKECL